MHFTDCHFSAIVMADRITRWAVDFVAMLAPDMASEEKRNGLIFAVRTTCPIKTPGDIGVCWLEMRASFARPHNLVSVACQTVTICAARHRRNSVPSGNCIHEWHIRPFRAIVPTGAGLRGAAAVLRNRCLDVVFRDIGTHSSKFLSRTPTIRVPKEARFSEVSTCK